MTEVVADNKVDIVYRCRGYVQGVRTVFNGYNPFRYIQCRKPARFRVGRQDGNIVLLEKPGHLAALWFGGVCQFRQHIFGGIRLVFALSDFLEQANSILPLVGRIVRKIEIEYRCFQVHFWRSHRQSSDCL